MSNFLRSSETLKLASSLLECASQCFFSEKDIVFLVNSKDKQQQLREFLQKLISPIYDFTDKSKIQTSKDQNLSNLIQMGKYSQYDIDSFLKRHPDLPISYDWGNYEYRLVSFDKPVSEKEFLEELNRDSFLSASIRHLLVYGAMFPESDDCIVSTRLSNIIDGQLCCPAIFKDKKHERRELTSWRMSSLKNLQPVERRFFLTVKKLSKC